MIISSDAFIEAKYGFYNWTPETAAQSWAKVYRCLGEQWHLSENKHLVMLAGIPASGKSTAAPDIHRLIGKEAVVLDSTMVSRMSRSAILNIWKGLGGTVDCVVPFRVIDDILASNAGRSVGRRIPDYAIDRMIKQWEPPSLDEGFDHVYVWQASKYDLVAVRQANSSWNEDATWVKV